MVASVIFRAGWKHIFCIPNFKNVSPGDGSDWVKATHCVVETEWNFFFLVLQFFISAFYYILC